MHTVSDGVVFPEMRAQLRTYHSIPCLQAKQDPMAYKQLQDAPRLKSILKGASEDIDQPGTIEDIMAQPVPRTNPVNLIFVMSQYAPKISDLHFVPPRDFFDLVVRPSLSSKSRATAFLWLMWYYLESDLASQAALDNPFGPGQFGPDGDTTSEMPIKCPPFEFLTPEQEELENVDTSEEKLYGEIKRNERKGKIHPTRSKHADKHRHHQERHGPCCDGSQAHYQERCVSNTIALETDGRRQRFSGGSNGRMDGPPRPLSVAGRPPGEQY